MPEDPVTENMNILNMKPVKAFLYQDHQAHIQVHMNAMQDPKLAQLIGQNPQAQAIAAAGMAHIQQHLAFEYRKQMEDMMGTPLPTGEEENEEAIPRDIELQISRMAAQASDALLQRNKTEVAAQQAQQAAQDPVIQMQAKELELKQQEEQRKAQKDQADAAEAAARLEVERERIASQERIAQASLLSKQQKDQQELEIKAMQAVANVNKPQSGKK
jgi:glycerol-3-phosphate dehydrogenase